MKTIFPESSRINFSIADRIEALTGKKTTEVGTADQATGGWSKFL
jgi:hypothetical protein